jgi:abelson tyrosine-protein kinase 1
VRISDLQHSSLDGTLRWQSPELMAGQSRLTQEMDVWAFSICCVEILTMGRIPWPLHNDDSVRYFVLSL